MTTDEYVDSLHEELNEKGHRIAELEKCVRELGAILGVVENSMSTTGRFKDSLMHNQIKASITRAKALVS